MKRNETKFIMKEIFIGTKSATMVFSELAEQKSCENVWTSEKPEGIMNSTTVNLNPVVRVSGGNYETTD